MNLFGLIADFDFLTKGGDVGLVLAVSGVDFQRFASAEVDNTAKRLESGLKIFDEGWSLDEGGSARQT